MSKKVAIFVSGGGSNMRTLVEDMTNAHPARPCVVVSNNAESGGISWAQGQGIATEVVDHRPFNGDRTAFEHVLMTRLAKYEPDIICLAGFMRKLTGDFTEAWAGRMINIHPSLLPKYRGPSAVNWPIIMGEAKSGYSWFYPSDGLDEGDCLLQWECDIGPDDTVIDLYFKKIYPSAVESVLTVCDLFRSGNTPRIVPDESRATYERRCTKTHARIEWHRPVGQVYNLIRGTNPAPGAWTTINGAELGIFDAALVQGDGVSGRVREISADGVSVQCIGGRVLVKRVRPTGGAKQSAADWAASVGLKPGDKLGT